MKSVLSVIFRRKREALIFALCMILFPTGIAQLLTEKYGSTASVLLTAGRFKKPFLPNEKNSQTGFIQISMEDVASEVELLTSRPVLEKVVKDNKLDYFPEPGEDEVLKRLVWVLQKGLNAVLVGLNLKKEMTDFELAVEKLDSEVDVEFLKRTNIITVKWKGYTPVQARNVVNSLVTEYIKHHIQVHGYASARGVIDTEMKSNEQRVLELEAQINQVRAQYGSFDVDKERGILVESYLAAKTTYENLLQVDANSVSATHRGVYATDPTLVGLMQELSKVELERIENAARYGDSNRRVETNDAQIASLKAQIKREHLHNLGAWRETVQATKLKLDKASAVQATLAPLVRDLAGATDAYQISRQKYTEAVISAAMDGADIASVRVVAPASFVSVPSYPRKILLLVISVFFAIVGGIAAAFGAEKMYSRVISVGNVETYTKLAVLISTPEFKRRELKNQRWLTNSLSRRLAAVRHFLNDTVGQGVVHLVLSPAPGAGSSFMTNQLAAYAHRATKAPSLVLDVRDDKEGQGGVPIDQAVLDPAAHVQQVDGIDRLKIAISPDDLSSDDSPFRHLLAKLKTSAYGNIFIDIPNERNDSSFFSIAPCSDHIYINVAYDRTDKFALRRFVSVIEEQAERKPVGAFFTRRENPVPDFIYRRL